jgi:predicted porin
MMTVMNPRFLGVVAACVAGAAFADGSVALYGDIDQALNYMKSSSGATVKSLQDGPYMRSRIGLRGVEDLGGGLSAKFQLESGLSSDTGASADSSRFFDRQAWLGLQAKDWGEVRLGRQNSAAFVRGGNVDFTARTLGAIVNNFGVPARYDNDVSWISPKVGDFGAEIHYALGESTSGVKSQGIYQLALDYEHGPLKMNYAGLRAKPAEGAAYSDMVRYDNVNANWDWGGGKVYVAWVHSNNITSSTSGATAGSLLGPTGTLLTGTSADVKNFYTIWQVSADYRVTPALRVGALYGKILGSSNAERGAEGGAVGAYYDLSKRTMLYGLLESMSNEKNAGFRPAGSAAVSPNFSGSDVNGQRISGLQLGIVHRF